VKLTKKDGTSVEFVAMVQSDPDSKLNHTKAIALEDIQVVQDYLDVFLEELPGMPPEHDCHILKFSFRNVNHFSHKKLKISKQNSFILT
jgi:hypothetical protein